MKADQLAELPQWKSSGWEDGVPRRDEKTRRGRGRWIEGATAFVMSYHEILMRDGPFGWPWDFATCYFGFTVRHR